VVSASGCAKTALYGSTGEAERGPTAVLAQASPLSPARPSASGRRPHLGATAVCALFPAEVWNLTGAVTSPAVSHNLHVLTCNVVREIPNVDNFR
jgi:hypothetical protein